MSYVKTWNFFYHHTYWCKQGLFEETWWIIPKSILWDTTGKSKNYKIKKNLPQIEVNGGDGVVYNQENWKKSQIEKVEETCWIIPKSILWDTTRNNKSIKKIKMKIFPQIYYVKYNQKNVSCKKKLVTIFRCVWYLLRKCT